jgi:hypothetical protein
MDAQGPATLSVLGNIMGVGKTYLWGSVSESKRLLFSSWFRGGNLVKTGSLRTQCKFNSHGILSLHEGLQLFLLS